MSLSTKILPSKEEGKLRATGVGVENIDLLTENENKVESLFLSYNLVSSLENITQFCNLQTLYIDYNNIKRIEDLLPLSFLKNLKNIKIEGNPVANLPLFDIHLIKICDSIRIIDGLDIIHRYNREYSVAELFSFVKIEKDFFVCNYISTTIMKYFGCYNEELFNEYDDFGDFSHHLRVKGKYGDPKKYLRILQKIVNDSVSSFCNKVQQRSEIVKQIRNMSIEEVVKISRLMLQVVDLSCEPDEFDYNMLEKSEFIDISDSEIDEKLEIMSNKINMISFDEYESNSLMKSQKIDGLSSDSDLIVSIIDDSGEDDLESSNTESTLNNSIILPIKPLDEQEMTLKELTDYSSEEEEKCLLEVVRSSKESNNIYKQNNSNDDLTIDLELSKETKKVFSSTRKEFIDDYYDSYSEFSDSVHDSSEDELTYLLDDLSNEIERINNKYVCNSVILPLCSLVPKYFSVWKKKLFKKQKSKKETKEKSFASKKKDYLITEILAQRQINESIREQYDDLLQDLIDINNE